MLEVAKYHYDIADKEIYLSLKQKVNDYFGSQGIDKYGNLFVLSKSILLAAAAVLAYIAMLSAGTWWLYTVCFFLFLSFKLIIGMTAGHDAAHGCLSGNKKIDHILFHGIFMMNGINPGPWKEKHNKSHHSFPNVHEYDSDMELSSLIYLSTAQKKYSLHRFQHIYAPILYLCFTLGWIYFFDFVYHFKKNQGNLVMKGNWSRLPAILIIKLFDLAVCLLIPLWFAQIADFQIILGFLAAHAMVSLLLSFTFFMSHHVMEAQYAETVEPNTITSSWLRHQVDTTVDFHGESKVANFFFGGFHAHTAHHLFPGICHVHYPAITSIIRGILEQNDLNYRSIPFHRGILSHLQLLKKQGAS